MGDVSPRPRGGCALQLNYYHPWIWAGAEPFGQLGREELRQGRSLPYVYVNDGGLRDVVEANVRAAEYRRLALYRLIAPNRTVAVSPYAREMSGEDAVTLDSLLDTFQPAYVRAHVPVEHYVATLGSAAFRDVPFVYVVMDYWDDFEKTPWGDSTTEAFYFQRANAVIVVSELLLRSVPDRSKGYLVPNAIDRDFLQRIAPSAESAKRPPGALKRVLYMGALGGSWFDWDTVRTLVRELDDHAFTFVGPSTLPPDEVIAAQTEVDRHLEQLRRCPNVRVVPEVPHDELVPWLRAADVGIIPFLPCRLTTAVSPLKVYEYLGAGAVVVQSGMPDIEPYPGVRTATSGREFVELVRASDRATLEREEARRMAEFCAQNTWEVRVAQFDGIVENLA